MPVGVDVARARATQPPQCVEQAEPDQAPSREIATKTLEAEKVVRPPEQQHADRRQRDRAAHVPKAAEHGDPDRLRPGPRPRPGHGHEGEVVVRTGQRVHDGQRQGTTGKG